MPKVPMDFSKTHFYKIVCNDLDIKDCYVGHTTNFVKRRNQHKTRCCNPNNPKHHFKVYKFIRDNGHWENWSMILIDTFDCEGKLDALKKEREFYEELKPTLNIVKPMTTYEEKRAYQKEWVGINRERVREVNNKCNRKDRENNPLKYRQIDKNTYLNRPAEFFEKQNRKLDCNCGGKYTWGHKAVHFKSKKHQNYINSLQD